MNRNQSVESAGCHTQCGASTTCEPRKRLPYRAPRYTRPHGYQNTQHSNARRGCANDAARLRFRTCRGPLCSVALGHMHLGNVFSCLCSWLSASSQGGSVVLRINLDDRCKRPELAAQLIDDLAWLGLEWTRFLLPARSPRPVRERLAPAARRRPHLPLLLHARRAPRRERAARQRRHAHLPRRLPRPFGRRGRPPQCPARPGHAPARARHRRPRG